MSKKIGLTRGKYAIVDDEDFEEMNKFKWYAQKIRKDYYACRTPHLKMEDGKQIKKTILMHRAIINCKKGLIVDHINHDSLDNRKENLRIVSNRQNLQNLKKSGTSKYPGVRWRADRKRWVSTIYINGKVEYLGSSPNEKEVFSLYKKRCEELGERVLFDEE